MGKLTPCFEITGSRETVARLGRFPGSRMWRCLRCGKMALASFRSPRRDKRVRDYQFGHGDAAKRREGAKEAECVTTCRWIRATSPVRKLAS